MMILINIIKNLFRSRNLNFPLLSLKLKRGSRGLLICALLAVILLTPAVQAQKLDDSVTQQIERANELLQKNRTAQEDAELKTLMTKASSVPQDKQNKQTKALIQTYNKQVAKQQENNRKRFNQLLSAPATADTIAEMESLKDNLGSLSGQQLNAVLNQYYNKRDKYEVSRLAELKSNSDLLSEEEQKEMEALNQRFDAKIDGLEKNVLQLQEAIRSPETSAQQKAALQQELVKTQAQISAAKATIAPIKMTSCSRSCAPKCYYKELQMCSFCPLFKTFFNTASVIAQHAINTFSGSIIKVVIIAFGIWIAMQVLAFVATPETRDLKDLASALITQSFIVMLVVLILEGGAMAFFNYALTPVYTTGQNIAQAIIKPNDVSKMETKMTETAQQKSSVIAACSGGDATGIYNPEKGKGALPKAMGDSIICTMTLIQNRTAQIKALGSASLCMSWEASFVWLIPHLNYLFIGLGLWISAMVMLLAVPFMMIDVVFELGVAAAMLPFAIGSYAFKITRGYTKKVWETFLNSVFKFIFVSLAALMLIVAFQEVITGSTGDLSYMFKENASAAVLNDLLDKLPWFSTHFLKLIFVMILTWSVLSATLEFAGEFAGSISETAIGSSIGTMAGSFTKSAATKILEPTLKATGRHLWSGAKAVAVAPVHLTRRAVNNRRAEKIQKYGKVNAEGNMELASKHWWGDKKLVLMQNTDGSKSIRKDKIRQTRNGQVVKSKLMNENFNIRTITAYDKDGKELYSKEKVRLNSSMAQDLLRKDGTVSHDLEKLMVDRSVEGADKFNIALAKEVMAQRMPNTKFDMKNHDYLSQEASYEGGKFVGYIETHKDGSKTIIRMNLSGEDRNGRKHLMTDFTRIDAKGRGTCLTSDGIINRRQTFVTQDGTVNSAVKQDSVKSSYRLSAHYDKLYENNSREKVNRAMQYSMFSEDEAKSAHRQIFSGHADRSIYEFEVYHS